MKTWLCCKAKKKKYKVNMKQLSFFFSFFLVLSGCIQFKVDTLKPDLLTKIPLGSQAEQVNAVVVNNVLTNIPLRIASKSGLVYLTDNNKASIKVFDNQGNLEFVIGKQLFDEENEITTYPYKFGSLGHLSIDSDNQLYIQNRFGKKEDLALTSKDEDLYKKFSGSFNPSPSSPLPSYVIKMNRKGIVQSILGAKGKNTEPFRYIEYTIATKEDHLFVYHKMSEEMRLVFLDGDKPAGEIRESKLDIFQNDSYKTMQIRLDTMIPHPEGEYALIAASFYNQSDKRFKFRKIFKVSFSQPQKTIPLKEIQDPAELLFSVMDNGEFYIWETEEEGSSIRFQVHDPEGNHINNKRIHIDPPRGQWREIYVDGQGMIYSIRIRAGSLELYRWR